jgi:hypothetical protein
LERQNKTEPANEKAFVEKPFAAKDSSLFFPNPHPTCIFET